MLSAPHGRGAARTANGKECLYADVLDAWFDPAPGVIEAFMASVAKDIRSSPETYCQPLVDAISEHRGIHTDCITVGAGSSELIHRVLGPMIAKKRVLLLDPTYSEYPFLSKCKDAKVTSLASSPINEFVVSVQQVIDSGQDQDVVILVNPANPTGVAFSREQVLEIRNGLPAETVLWIDEAYIDYFDPSQSVEYQATVSTNLYVLKSMSKAYALSGLRSAYLISSSENSLPIKLATPPWIVGSAAQRAAAVALNCTDYYVQMWNETARLRNELATNLVEVGFETFVGHLNSVLIKMPNNVSAKQMQNSLEEVSIFVRSSEGMGSVLGDNFLRIAVLEQTKNERMLSALAHIVESK